MLPIVFFLCAADFQSSNNKNLTLLFGAFHSFSTVIPAKLETQLSIKKLFYAKQKRSDVFGQKCFALINFSFALSPK